MVEFFQNIGKWFIDNKDQIILFLTSGTFITIVGAIAAVVKQIKVNKNSNVINSDLRNTLKVTNEQNKAYTKLSEDVSAIQEDVDTIKKDTANTLDTLTAKINAMIDVQTIVYSTIHDETMRKNVNTLLLNAKYSESTSRAELEAELTALKDQLKAKLEDVQETVTTVTDNVQNVVTGKTNKTVQRY